MDEDVVLQALTQLVTERLKSKKFCTVFESDLERCWPTEKAIRLERESKIHAFAKSRGWTAHILDPGIRVTFRKAVPDTSSPPSKV